MELENEIKMLKTYIGVSEAEELITIKFNSVKKDIDCSFIIKKTDNFSKLESMIYKKYPKYRETENFFLVGGNKINKSKTIEGNKIKNGDIIVVAVIDD